MTDASVRRWPPRFVLLVLLGVALRMGLSLFGYSHDVWAWQQAGDLLNNQNNVYASTDGYNYGPIWMYFDASLRAVEHALHLQGIRWFHLMLTGVLSLVDVGILLLLREVEDERTALFFFFNPVSIFITGWHGQFDNFAILLAFLAWCLVRPGQQRISLRSHYGAALLLGLSLICKHLFIFFPAWLFFLGADVPWRHRLQLIVIPPSMFLASFLPYLDSPAARAGVVENVFHYVSLHGTGIFPHALELFVPLDGIERWFGWVPVFAGIKFFFAAAMLGVGWFAARRRPHEAFYQYVLALAVFTTAITNQYFTIPVLACAVYRRFKAAWIYTAFTTFYLIGDRHGLGTDYFTSLRAAFDRVHLERYHAQVWLLVLFVAVWRAEPLRRRAAEAPATAA